MSDLIQRSKDIKNETTAGANTATRIGGVMEDQARASRVVDTIADLRAVEDMNDGDVVDLRGHTQQKFGGGEFEWQVGELFAINNVGGYSAGQQNITITALSEGVPADHNYGTNVVFENGSTGTIISNPAATGESPYGNRVRGYAEGDTEIKFILDADVVDGEKAFFADDNGMFARPDFVGFDGIGVWRRMFDEWEVNPMMYGGIPNNSPYDGAINNSYQALQDCFDSMYDVSVEGGSYYTDQTLIVRRNKKYEHKGDYLAFKGFGRNRRERAAFGRMIGVIYTDQDIDLIQLWGMCKYKGLLDVSQVPFHYKAAMRAMAAFRIVCEIDIKVMGNRQALVDNDADEDLGTRAFVIDAETPAPSDGNFSDSGYFAHSDVFVRAYGCYSIVGHTVYNGAINTFTNSTIFKVYGQEIVRGYDMKEAMASSVYEGDIQNVLEVLPNNWTQAEKDAFAFNDVQLSAAAYFNVRVADAGGRITHKITGNEFRLGPQAQRQLDKDITGTELPLEVIGDVIGNQFQMRNAKEYSVTKLTGPNKRVIIPVSAAEIQAAGTTDIPLIVGGGGGNAVDRVGNPVVKNVYLTNWTGTDDYTSNTNLDISSPAVIWGTINLAETPTADDRPLVAKITHDGRTFGGDIVLSCSTGDPAGGDRAFDIVIDYEDGITF